MFYGNGPQDTRSLFFSSWNKYIQKQPLTPLEQQLVALIIDHPEYHHFFEQTGSALAFAPGLGGIEHDNPFLHLGLHLTVRDQIQLNRPTGIATVYQTLLTQHPLPHHVEHLMMEPLAACLWEANQAQRPPNDAAYLNACQELIS